MILTVFKLQIYILYNMSLNLNYPTYRRIQIFKYYDHCIYIMLCVITKTNSPFDLTDEYDNTW